MSQSQISQIQEITIFILLYFIPFTQDNKF